jgi:hypothetical protein
MNKKFNGLIKYPLKTVYDAFFYKLHNKLIPELKEITVLKHEIHNDIIYDDLFLIFTKDDVPNFIKDLNINEIHITLNSVYDVKNNILLIYSDNNNCRDNVKLNEKIIFQSSNNYTSYNVDFYIKLTFPVFNDLIEQFISNEYEQQHMCFESSIITMIDMIK